MTLEGPDFICIGPKKTATTWLADHLKFHRDIWLPPIQELNYLNGTFSEHRDRPQLRLRWDRWSIFKRIVRNKSFSADADRAFLRMAEPLAHADAFDLGGYRSLFTPGRQRITGDISPMYASLEGADFDRAMPVLDQARIFLLARDPVQRFWSELSMHARKRTFGDVDYASIETAHAFFNDPERRKQHLLSDIVERWRSALGGDRLRIFFFDDIAAQPEQSLRAIVDYIGADYRKRLALVSPARNRKAGGVRLVPDDDAREWVRQAFEEELRACEALFGDVGARWRRRHSGG